MKSKGLFYTLPVFFLIAFVLISSCDKIYDPIIVQGNVKDVDTSEPISSAIVQIISPEDIAAQTFSNEAGLYIFDEVDVDSVINITVQASKEGYSTEMITVLAAPEKELTIPDLRLKRTNGVGDDPDDTSTGSGGSSSITLASKSKDFIQVRGTGGDETVDFEFVVRDSSGVPLTDDQSVYVRFEITSGPNGGESIYPDSARTQAGIARATLTSGTKAGAVQIRASFNRNGISSHSSPVPITISGGLPNDNHFEVSSEFKNIPAHTSTPNEITVLLGDKHGNPVIPGTAVYFSTSKGLINGSANTDDVGYVTSLLRTNNTSPGMATVTIETVDEANSRISRQMDVLFSGRPTISVTPEMIDISSLRSQDFKVNLADKIGNPLGPGTTFEVNVDNNDLILSGTTFVELADTQNNGNGYTDFEFQLRKPDNIAVTEDVTLTITSAGPNGTVTRELLFPVDEVEPGQPGSIYLESITETDIGVRSTGQQEQTQLTFQVVDVNGKPLNNQNKVDVNFVFGDRPFGDEFLSPTTTTTNHLGQATVTLTSGTGSGPVQIVAEINHNGRMLRSLPIPVSIHAGHPSQNHFSIVPEKRNVNANIFDQTVIITALAGDRYGNTVPDGTSIYFTTNGGFIQGSSLTNNGRAVVELTVANPMPPSGVATVRANTADHNQNSVQVSTNIIFSIDPIITVYPESINLADGEDQTFHYSVKDIHGNPMVEGTSISVVVEGTDYEIIGDTDITLKDINASGSNINELTNFSFNIRDTDPGNINDTPIIITIEVDAPNGYASKRIEGRKAKIR